VNRQTDKKCQLSWGQLLCFWDINTTQGAESISYRWTDRSTFLIQSHHHQIICYMESTTACTAHVSVHYFATNTQRPSKSAPYHCTSHPPLIHGSHPCAHTPAQRLTKLLSHVCLSSRCRLVLVAWEGPGRRGVGVSVGSRLIAYADKTKSSTRPQRLYPYVYFCQSDEQQYLAHARPSESAAPVAEI